MSYSGPHYPTGSCVGNRGCRRTECVEAYRITRKRRRVDRDRGQPRLVDAAPTIAHLERLQAQGMTLIDVARMCGLHRMTVYTVPRSQRIHRQTRDRILAVTCARPQYVDGIVPWRQLRALVALGYPSEWIRAQIHAGPYIVAGRPPRPILLRTAERIDALARQIGDTPGPSAHARATAAARGYLVPAWYDENWQPCPNAPRSPAQLAAALSKRPDAAERREQQRALAVRLYSDGQPVSTISARLTAEFGAWGSSARAVHRYVAAEGLTGRKSATG